MKYLLDTDHFSFLQRRAGSEYRAIMARVARAPASEVAVSVVGFHEQFIGVHAQINRAKGDSQLVRGYEMLEQILTGFSALPVLPFDSAAATVAEQLRRSHGRIAAMDRRIAAIALANGLAVVTRNFRDFRGVPGLLLEDWTVTS